MNVPRQRTLFPRRILSIVAALLVFSGCGGGKTITVEIPPLIDLREWPVVGLIDFSANTHAELAPAATRKFMMHVQSAQPGVRLLELGSRERVLAAVNGSTLDPETIRAIGSRYGVDAVLVGDLLVSEPTPKIDIAPDLKSLSAKATVKGELNAKVQETSTGATVWSNGAHGQWSVAKMSLGQEGLSNVGFRDPGDRYDRMLRDLTEVATNDFRPTYRKRRVQN